MAKKAQIYFTDMFYKITTLTIAITFCLSVFLYIYFSNYGVSLINQLNKRFLDQMIYNALQINDNIRIYSNTLFNSKEFLSLTYAPSVDLGSQFSTLQSIEYNLSGMPYILSAYLYNGKIDTFITLGLNSTIQKKSEFFDRDAISLLQNIQKNKSVAPIVRRLPPYNSFFEGGEKVYTYIIPEWDIVTDSLKRALIINAKADMIFNTVTLQSKGDFFSDSRIYILDSKGNVIGCSQDNYFLNNLSSESYIQRVLTSQASSGYFVTTIDNTQDQVVTYVSEKSTGWKLICITPYSSVTMPVKRAMYITFLISFVTLSIGLFLSFYLSRSLYAPIGNLFNKVLNLAGESGDKLPGTTLGNSNSQTSELEMIDKHVTSVKNKISNLQSFKDHNFSIVKKEFLENLLLANTEKGKDLQQSLIEYGFNLDITKNFRLVIFKIDHYQDFCNKLDQSTQSLYKFALTNIGSEILSALYPCEMVDMGGDHVVAILSITNDIKWEQSYTEDLIIKIQNIFDAYSIYFRTSFTTLIGKVFTNFSEIHPCYKKALEMSSYRISHGHGSILLEEALEEFDSIRPNISDYSIKLLLDSLIKCKMEDVEKYLSDLLSCLYRCNYKNTILSLSYLSSSVFNTLNLIEKNNTITLETDFISFADKTSTLETLEEVKTEYLQLFQTVINKILSCQDDKNLYIVEKIKKYIETNYTNRNLSLAVIADVFGMSQLHIGKIFREHEMKSIADHINEYRLAKSLELLKSSSLSVEEILGKIGWENRRHFYTLFKKTYGSTPTQYKLKSAVNDI